MIRFERCWTGRRWVQVGYWLAIGFGPFGFITRVWWRGRLVYVNQKAQQRYRIAALAYEAEKEVRRQSAS